jgi:predicted RNase H-like HicB family nuclease
MRTYTVIVHEEDDPADGFWAEVEELPGCFGSGETLDELEADIKDAIESYLLALEAHGQPIPKGRRRRPLESGTRRWELAVAI